MFRGVANLSLDSKGRLVVPARYRAAVQERCAGRLVITVDPDKCLLIYPLPDWEPIEQQLNNRSNLDSRVRALQRLLIGHAEDIMMDNAGRVLLPPELRSYAELQKSVVLAGQGKKFELWDKEKWEHALTRVGTLNDGELPPELGGLSL